MLKKGDAEAGFWPAEPYFYPFYEEAERLDLPICFHVGTGFSGSMPLDRLSYFSFHQLPPVGAERLPDADHLPGARAVPEAALGFRGG